MGLLISLLMSALAGYIGGTLMKVSGPWYFNLILGLVGGFVGNLLFGLLGIYTDSIIGEALFATIGACVTIFLYKKLKK